MAGSGVSPGIGTTSSPVPHTARIEQQFTDAEATLRGAGGQHVVLEHRQHQPTVAAARTGRP